MFKVKPSINRILTAAKIRIFLQNNLSRVLIRLYNSNRQKKFKNLSKIQFSRKLGKLGERKDPCRPALSDYDKLEKTVSEQFPNG